MTSKISSSMVLTCRQFIRAATISTHNNRLLRLTFQLVPSFCQIDRRNFHSSVPLSFAKSQKGGKKKGGRDDADDDNDSEPKASASLPDIKTYDSLMEKRLDRLVEEFDKLRVGRPSADMLNHIVVDAHGARMRITELGQILMKNQSTISISVFDPAHVSAVAAAIRQDSNMNLNPNADGNTVIVNVPKPSKESRDTFIKAAAKSADKVRFQQYQPTFYKLYTCKQADMIITLYFLYMKRLKMKLEISVKMRWIV